MGTWGTQITENDTFADVYSTYFDYYDDGLDESILVKQLDRDFQEVLDHPGDAHNFWFAVAAAQWECGQLRSNTLEKVQKIIESDEHLANWKDLGASSDELEDRKSALSNFLSKLQSKNSRPRKRKKKTLYDSVFKKGDCLAYRMAGGRFGGLFVLEEEQATKTGYNLVALTTIEKESAPTIDDFKTAYVFVQRIKQHFDVNLEGQKLSSSREVWRERPLVGWAGVSTFTPKEIEIQKVGTLPVNKNYSSQYHDFMHMRWDSFLSALAERQINSTSNPKTKLRDWRLNKRWRSLADWFGLKR